jgi:type I restriction enzyme, S subunit
VIVVPLSDAVVVNPKIDRTQLADDSEVSFVPMAAVGAADGSIDASTVRPYAEVKKGYTHFRENDVLFAKVTPCMENGKMAVARNLKNGIGFGSTEFHVLRPRDGVDPHYVYHFVSSQTFRKEAARHMTGAVGLRRVPTAFLESAESPLPALDEQREIVAELEKQFSRLDEAVANLQRVKANLKRYKASVLKAAVEGRLVETEATLAHREGRTYETGEQLLQRILDERRAKWTGKGKFKEPLALVAPDLSGLPEGWALATYCQLGDVTTGFTPPTGDAANFGGDTPFFKPTDLDAGDSVRVAREYLSAAGLQKGRKLPAGSVLVTCIGATIGKTGLTQVGCATNQQINSVSPVDNCVDSRYLFWWTCSPVGQAQIVDNASATTLPILNKSKFEALPVALPPVAEQARIVAEVDRHLSIIREVEAEVDANLQRAQALRQATLSRAFQ